MKFTIINLAFICLITFATSCSAQSKTVDPNPTENRDRKGPPSIDEIFRMDVNKDGLLSKEEVKGPLQNEFDQFDTNKDGFLSKEEVEKSLSKPKGPRKPRQ